MCDHNLCELVFQGDRMLCGECGMVIGHAVKQTGIKRPVIKGTTVSDYLNGDGSACFQN